MTAATPDIAALLTQLVQALTQTTRVPAQPKPRPMPERVLLNVEEAAHQLRIGRTVAWRLVKTGELDSVLIGRLRRVPSTAITEYAARLVAEQSRKSRS